MHKSGPLSFDADKHKNTYVAEIISLNKQAKMGYTENKSDVALLVYESDGEFFEYDNDKWIPDYMIAKILSLDRGKDVYPELFL